MDRRLVGRGPTVDWQVFDRRPRDLFRSWWSERGLSFYYRRNKEKRLWQWFFVERRKDYRQSFYQRGNRSQADTKGSGKVGSPVLTVTLLISHEWPRKDFSLLYQYSIKDTSDENLKKYQLAIICRSNTKFFKLTAWELYGTQ